MTSEDSEQELSSLNTLSSSHFSVTQKKMDDGMNLRQFGCHSDTAMRLSANTTTCTLSMLSFVQGRFEPPRHPRHFKLLRPLTIFRSPLLQFFP
ncbi:hypothetical protein TNCV_1908301 [Trichonephila clavipes]|nr:hypothetical protein TNCV_1908301 [Trichonephila clavipes]